jgi:hypothetical protein
MVAFQFLLQSGRHKKVGSSEVRQVVSGQKFPGKKNACYHDATASSFVNKVCGKVFTNLHKVIMKHHSNMWN